MPPALRHSRQTQFSIAAWITFLYVISHSSSHQLFEGLKAYPGDHKRLRLFRPMLNINADRMCGSDEKNYVFAFDESELLECIRRLVEIDQDWVSNADLYIRPTFISTEPSLGVKKPAHALLYVIMCLLGPYFDNKTGVLALWADPPKYTRAWKGGTGDCKMGGNYGCSLSAQYEAVDYGCQQVLWLHGEDHQITEAGTMNIFLHWINEHGDEELATPPQDDIILPGVTRQKFEVTERYLTMSQLFSALKQQRVKEMFGSGTACMIRPTGRIIRER
uniref:Branched-chain-amino-acid aminotransferase n=1 Tax=Mola mola TaxID=94237 RepID=A0A3Q3W816_MOLML